MVFYFSLNNLWLFGQRTCPFHWSGWIYGYKMLIFFKKYLLNISRLSNVFFLSLLCDIDNLYFFLSPVSLCLSLSWYFWLGIYQSVFHFQRESFWFYWFSVFCFIDFCYLFSFLFPVNLSLFLFLFLVSYGGSLDQRAANYSPWAKYGPVLASVNKVLLQSSHGHSF